MRRKSDLNSMDPISLPDKDKINSLEGGHVNSRRVHLESGIDDFTNVMRANFDTATPVKLPERVEEDEKDELDVYLEEQKALKERYKPTKSVKVGKKYVASWLVKRIAIIAAAVLVVVMTFLPPICTSTDEGSATNRNIFETQNVSGVKETLLADAMVYNIDNMTSERAGNYRVCTVGIDISNYSPFKVVADGFSIFKCDPTYKDKFVAVTVPEGKIELSPFKVTTVTAEVLINVSELSDEQLGEAMTSLVLKTSGMWKKLGPLPIPVVPALIPVSDALEFHLN